MRTPEPGPESVRAIEIRHYRARTQADAAELFVQEADDAAREGWEPEGQPIWSPPQTWRVFVTPLLLIVAGYLAGLVFEGFSSGYSAYQFLGAVIGGVIGVGYVLLKRPLGPLNGRLPPAPPLGPF